MRIKRKPFWMRGLSVFLVHALLLQGILPSLWAAQEAQKARAESFVGHPLPVDLRAGAVVLPAEDLKLGLSRLPLTLSRVYRSDIRQAEPGVFGRGWHSYIDMRLIPQGTDLALLDDGGRWREYASQPNGTWISKTFDYETIRARQSEVGWERHLKNGIVYRFGADGFLAEIADSNGRFVRIRRLEPGAGEGEAEAKRASVRLEDRHGRHIELALDSEGRAETAADSSGRTCRYAYDEQGRLQAFTDPAGGTVEMAYDAEHRLIGLGSGPMAYELTWRAGRIATQGTSRGAIERYSHATAKDGALVCRVTDASGAETRCEFGPDGRVTTTAPGGVTESLWLNERELPVKVVGADGRMIEFAYDERANPVLARQAGGMETRWTYASDDTLSKVEDATGAKLLFSYDDRRNVVAIVNHLGARYEFEWDRQGFLRGARGAMGQSATLDYDTHGHVRSVKTGAGLLTGYVFNAAGVLQSITTPTGAVFDYAYDSRGLLTGVSNSEGQNVRVVRDARGRIVQQTDPAGNVSRMEYDPAGLLTSVSDPIGAVTRMDYDTLGRATALTDAEGNTTRWAYDASGRVSSETDALGRTASVTYTEAGRIGTALNRRGQSVTFVFDEFGRMTGRNADGNRDSFSYDEFGRMTGMRSADSHFEFELMAGGLIEKAFDRKANVEVSYEYDDAGRRVAMRMGGQETRYAYDPHGRLTAIESEIGRVTFEYDAYGRRSAMTYPNGARTTWRYDKLNRILEIRVVSDDGGEISRFRYEYDEAGNRTRMTEGEDRVVNYVYDAANRLVRVEDDGRVTEYVYDRTGNRVAVLTDGEREDHVVGPDNRLLKAGETAFEYDADGNRIARIGPDGQRCEYRYDAMSRLVEANGKNGKVSYAYAPNRARVARAENGRTTRFAFDHENVTLEIRDGTPAARYLHGPGIDEPLALTRGDATVFYHADALGSIARLSDPAGKPAGHIHYDAFGRIVESENALGNTFAFTGREWDEAANLYCYRARFYDADVGRFMSKDLLGLLPDVNPYAYVLNNPVNATDPSGECVCAVAIVGGAIGFVSYTASQTDWGNFSLNTFKPSNPVDYINLATGPGLYVNGKLAKYMASNLKPSFNWGHAFVWTATGALAPVAAKWVAGTAFVKTLAAAMAPYVGKWLTAEALGAVFIAPLQTLARHLWGGLAAKWYDYVLAPVLAVLGGEILGQYIPKEIHEISKEILEQGGGEIINQIADYVKTVFVGGDPSPSGGDPAPGTGLPHPDEGTGTQDDTPLKLKKFR